MNLFLFKFSVKCTRTIKWEHQQNYTHNYLILIVRFIRIDDVISANAASLYMMHKHSPYHTVLLMLRTC